MFAYGKLTRCFDFLNSRETTGYDSKATRADRLRILQIRFAVRENRACAVLKESGHATAVLTTEAGTRAERFYRADGWTEIGRKEDGQIIFQKNLSSEWRKIQ